MNKSYVLDPVKFVIKNIIKPPMVANKNPEIPTYNDFNVDGFLLTVKQTVLDEVRVHRDKSGIENPNKRRKMS